VLSSFIAKDDRLEYNGDDNIRSAYNFIRESIMDSKIPVCMPIGFKLLTSTSTGVTAIDREVNCMESMLAVSGNVRDILFVGRTNWLVQSDYLTGEINTGNAKFNSQGEYNVEAVDKGIHLLTAIERIQIAFYVKRDCGYKSMAENVELVGDDGYFPLNTTFSLLSYINVFPLSDNIIRVSYKRGMTPFILNKILKGE
jgi:hypothetical protein